MTNRSNLGYARSTIYQVTHEDSFASLGGIAMGPSGEFSNLVAELAEQCIQLFDTAMDIADDVKGLVLILQIVPKRLARGNRNRADFLGTGQAQTRGETPRAPALESTAAAAAPGF